MRRSAPGIVVCVLLSLSASAAIPSSEREVLLTIYSTMGGPSWTRNGGWNDPPGTECSWYGVTCDSGQTTVTGLNLGWNNVAGPIPPTIRNLPNLEVLDLTSVRFSGGFPNEVTQLSKLKVLRLGAFYGAPLGGTIDPDIANLVNLEQLDLSGNQLTGTIPPAVAGLPKLKSFIAFVNKLSGSIPHALFTHPKLEYLDISYNDLSGELPASISLPETWGLYLNHNDFSGPFPAALSLPKITRLEVSENRFSGAIPAAIGQLATLERLTVYDNQFTSVPAEIGNLSNLTYLDLGRNPWNGGIPPAIGNLTKLTYFSTYSSTFSGPIPDSIFTLPVLETLFLTGNTYNGQSATKLSGNFSDFTRLTTLVTLGISAQDIHGPIPPEISRLTKLTHFEASYNPIGGPVPAELGQITSLQSINLNFTDVEGALPDSIGQLVSLKSLGLRDCSITSLPDSMRNLTALTGLELSGNELGGPIPPFLSQLTLLRFLSLDSNELSGPIPANFFAKPDLVELYLGSNRLTGEIPPVGAMTSLQTLHIQSNQLTGPLPPDLGSLTKLKDLNLSGNRLTGPIALLDGLTELYRLRLYDNELSGSLEPLGSLSDLEEIYLFRNRLTGNIPASIGQLSKLRIANLSYNGLVGQIPPEIANCTSMQDRGLGLEHNGLTNDDPSLDSYLARTAPDFARRQTVAPGNVAVSAARERSLVLSWTPILYTDYAGGYIISVATNPSGPFAVAVTTPDKLRSTFTLDGLSPSTDYFVRVATSTYANPYNRNTVTSSPSATVPGRTTDGSPAPASVVVLRLPPAIRQDTNVGGGRTGYVLANVGDLPATVTLAREGDFFTQSPESFTIAPGASKEVFLTGLARPTGVYSGASVPSGIGVPAGLRLAVRLLVTEPVLGTANAVASTNRVDVAADPAQTSLPAKVSFTNTGTAMLTGILETEAEWIAPPQGIVSIAPGATVEIEFGIDRTKRADASALAGTAISSLSLVYPTGAVSGGRSVTNGSATGASLVTVVDTVKPPTASVAFPPLAPGEVPLFLPGVGHLQGGVGLFLSDLSIINAFGTEALGDIRIFFTPAADLPLLTSATSARAVSPGQSFALADIVKSVFGVEQVGTIQVRSAGWSNLVLASNIFNVSSPRGTYGSSIPSFRGDRAADDGESLFINGLRKSDTTRTNVFVQETSGAAATADLAFYDASGSVLATTAAEVPAFQMVRLLDAAPSGAVAVRITNRDGSSGRITAYATPVDQTSGDFWSLADWNRVYDSLQNEPQFIPVAGKLHGANNNFFRSDVSVTATGGAPAAADIRLVYAGGAGIANASVSLGAGETLVLEDVIGTLFPTLPEPVVGSIVLTPVTGSVSVTSRTYATQDGVPGTFGTAVPTLPLSRTIRLGQTKVIAGLDVASIETIGQRTPATFRTNLFLVEATGAPATVRVGVIYADRSQAAFGSRLVTKTIDLAPNQIFQANVTQLIAETNPGVADLRNVQLEIRVTGGDGAVFAFTSSIDNGSADQILRVE